VVMPIGGLDLQTRASEWSLVERAAIGYKAQSGRDKKTSQLMPARQNSYHQLRIRKKRIQAGGATRRLLRRLNSLLSPRSRSQNTSPRRKKLYHESSKYSGIP
jgi:hypothetical protein